MTNEEFKTQMLESTERVFAMRKEIRPMLAVLDKGELKLAPLPMDNKDRAAAIIAKMRVMFPAMMFVTEAWAVESKDGKIPDVMPSEHPDRIEIVSVMFYFGMHVEATRAEIIRPTNGEPFLGPWKTLGDKIGGRLAATPPEWN